VFEEGEPMTVGGDVKTKTAVINGTRVRLSIWDTAGQELFRSIAPRYYRNAQMTLVIFAIDEEATFRNVQSWIDQIRNESPQTLIGLVGNKSDLPAREVDLSEACDFAASQGISYTETSAITGENIENVFVKLVTEYLEEKKGPVDPEQTESEGPQDNAPIVIYRRDQEAKHKKEKCHC
jgi:small GTP-binding protein